MVVDIIIIHIQLLEVVIELYLWMFMFQGVHLLQKRGGRIALSFFVAAI